MKTLICHDRAKVSLGIITLSFVLLAFTAGISQTAPINGGEWTRIESVSKDFSVALPSGDYLVDNENGKVRIWYGEGGRGFTVSMEKGGGAKSKLKSWVDPDSSHKYQSIALDDFIGRSYAETSEKTGAQYYSFDLASSHGLYSISVRVPQGDSEIAQRFVRSIRLGGKHIVKATVTDPTESQAVRADTYKTSAIVKQALKQPNANNLRPERYSGPPGPLKNDKTIYSRDLIILEKPWAIYTERARRDNISGTIRLRITFLANGTIGSIAAVKSLDGGLDQSAFEAAKGIKFLPAQIDGKSADAIHDVEYTFSIY